MSPATVLHSRLLMRLEMASNAISIPFLVLPDEVPNTLPAPKFQIGQQVYWQALSDPDFGHILGVIWATEASTKAIGFHYSVLLDTASPSSAFIQLDWAFEDDLAVMPLHPPLIVPT
ncbi:hypothetical protein [Pantanalinema sp. GBBB05]|uniref:hypothetical protein n=1 Tax=Pantanalinema sp. GBBB05 TaxID=2604139 RepID=UPI001E1A870E|nr:hypothetical protein [Pantanalinema sp. GBBB05]